MITVATLLWDANDQGLATSRCYDESWVEKLYRGFSRNLSRHSMRFVCFTERPRMFGENIEVSITLPERPGYADCVRPYELNEPMILVGLDTVITGNIDHLADYCLTADVLALPRDPYHPSRACNGVALVPGGHDWLWTEWNRAGSDMERCRAVEHALIDDLFPGQVASYKGAVKAGGIGDARIVYFHGREKPHELAALRFIQENWR